MTWYEIIGIVWDIQSNTDNTKLQSEKKNKNAFLRILINFCVWRPNAFFNINDQMACWGGPNDVNLAKQRRIDVQMHHCYLKPQSKY